MEKNGEGGQPTGTPTASVGAHSVRPPADGGGIAGRPGGRPLQEHELLQLYPIIAIPPGPLALKMEAQALSRNM